jgi:hypothetical protein
MDLKMMLAATVVVLAGCGGAAFSTEDRAPADDAGGDAEANKNDSGTAVATDADAGKQEASPLNSPETGSPPEAGVDAAPEASADASPEAAPPVCLSTLNDVGTGDFHISFTMTSASTQTIVPLVNQRTGCNQNSVFWQALVDGRAWDGKIQFDMCDVTGSGSCPNGPTVYTGSPVDDGQPHRIAIERVSGVISISSDDVAGTTSPDVALGVTLAGEGADASFETFGAPLTIGTDECGDPPLAAYGALTDLCITKP